MKVVYCAVHSSIQENKGISSAMKKQMQFSYSAVRYFLKSKDASEKYKNLRKELDVKFVRNVWDLLEDPMTSFFATSFGFAPAMERMKVNLEVRIPVQSGIIFNQVDQQQQKLYRTRSLSSAAFEKQVGLIPDSSEEEEGEEEKKGKKGKKGKKKGAQAHNIVLPADGNDESYLIRCRFLNPFNSPVDPSLVIKTNTRSNFMAKDQAEMKKNQDTLTRIFGKNLTSSHGVLSRNKKVSQEKRDSFDDGENDNRPDTLIIHIHGGGWVSQSPDQHIAYVSEWAKMANAPVISIDYSLSPEVKFPISPNECYAVYKWLLIPENASKLGLSTNPLKIVVCGDSAGGNLTCAVTLKVKKFCF